MVAGPNILDFQNIAWLDGDLDPPQHYLGWALYRNGPWTFPVGLNPNNGLDISNAIVFSDSVPIMAFLFKPFSLFLPKVFQYLGFWTLVCFILQTWFAWKFVCLLINSFLFRVFVGGIFVFYKIIILGVGVFFFPVWWGWVALPFVGYFYCRFGIFFFFFLFQAS